MYAIIETGGKQYRVSEGDVIRVERLEQQADEAVTFERVLAVGGGGDLRVGAPILPGARVTGRLLEHRREKKIRAFRYKPKKNVRRRTGHRQPFSRVRIEKIEA